MEFMERKRIQVVDKSEKKKYKLCYRFATEMKKTQQLPGF